MSKENKNWKKLADEQKPKEEDRTFDRKEVIKALIKIRRKRPMIRSGA